MTTLIYGFGINDKSSPVVKSIDGKKIRSRYYDTWYGMIRRCYSEKSLQLRPTYKDCSVAAEWLIFSNFEAWMKKQNWHDKQLDKDILIGGCIIYSPESCVFVSREANLMASNNRDKTNKTKGIKYVRGAYTTFAIGGYIGRFNSLSEAKNAAIINNKKKLMILAINGEDLRVIDKLFSMYCI